ncbi:MAG: hypothetical protein H0W78_04515 [Planctomycetes bacterium]|nr:hypothetical protein [Planctomycetota bacterium]
MPFSSSPVVLLLTLGALVLLGGCGAERNVSATSIDDLSRRLSTFHRQPTQDEFRVILNSFNRFDSNPEMRANASLMASFVVFATGKYGLSIDDAPDSLPLSRFRTADHMKFTAWLDDGSASPAKNDVLWMAFFCTGEEHYLDRLMAVAFVDASRTEGKSTVIDLAGSSAQWSYKSNAAQWPEVLRHAERLAAGGNTFAAECVAYAREHPEKRP